MAISLIAAAIRGAINLAVGHRVVRVRRGSLPARVGLGGASRLEVLTSLQVLASLLRLAFGNRLATGEKGPESVRWLVEYPTPLFLCTVSKKKA
jgi:hypothetical protein